MSDTTVLCKGGDVNLRAGWTDIQILWQVKQLPSISYVYLDGCLVQLLINMTKK